MPCALDKDSNFIASLVYSSEEKKTKSVKHFLIGNPIRNSTTCPKIIIVLDFSNPKKTTPNIPKIISAKSIQPCGTQLEDFTPEEMNALKINMKALIENDLTQLIKWRVPISQGSSKIKPANTQAKQHK